MNKKTVIVRPIEGKRVRAHDGVVLPEDGRRVFKSAYYDRRKAEGSIEIVKDTGQKLNKDTPKTKDIEAEAKKAGAKKE